MAHRRLTTLAVYHACEFSYLGSMAGVLKRWNTSSDIVDIGGYSGYAFLTKSTQGWTDPSAPAMRSGNVASLPETVTRMWSDLYHGTERLGVKITIYRDIHQSMGLDPEQSRLQVQRAVKVFDVVKDAIDHDLPVILWGLAGPEYGIVNGYEEEQYVVSTFRRLIGEADTAIRFDQLHAKGGLEALVVHPSDHRLTEADDHQAITQARILAEGSPYTFTFETPNHPIRVHQQYVTGVAAYDAWANVLEQRVPNTIFPDYQRYLAVCAHEQKQIAGCFLERLAQRYATRSQRTALHAAATAYTHAAEKLSELVWLFPDDALPQVSVERCLAGAALLRAAAQYETAAIEHLSAALQTWH